MKPRTIIGVCLILSQFGFWAGGGYLLNKAFDTKLRTEKQIAANDAQCVSLLKTIPSVNVVSTGRNIVVIMNDVVEPNKTLTDASVAALMCPNKELVEVCLGDECQGSNKKIIMRMEFKGK